MGAKGCCKYCSSSQVGMLNLLRRPAERGPRDYRGMRELGGLRTKRRRLMVFTMAFVLALVVPHVESSELNSSNDTNSDGVDSVSSTNETASESGTASLSSSLTPSQSASDSSTSSPSVTQSVTQSVSQTASRSMVETTSPSLSDGASPSASVTESSSTTPSNTASMSITPSQTPSSSQQCAYPSVEMIELPFSNNISSDSYWMSDYSTLFPWSYSELREMVRESEREEEVPHAAVSMGWAVNASVCIHQRWDDVLLPGRLFVPDDGDGGLSPVEQSKFGAMVILHGDDGLYEGGDPANDINAEMRAWRYVCSYLRRVCVFPDSFTPSTRNGIIDDPYTTRVQDAYATLEFLFDYFTADGIVDLSRVFVVGVNESAGIVMAAMSEYEPWPIGHTNASYLEDLNPPNATDYVYPEHAPTEWHGSLLFRGGVAISPDCHLNGAFGGIEHNVWTAYNPTLLLMDLQTVVDCPSCVAGCATRAINNGSQFTSSESQTFPDAQFLGVDLKTIYGFFDVPESTEVSSEGLIDGFQPAADSFESPPGLSLYTSEFFNEAFNFGSWSTLNMLLDTNVFDQDIPLLEVDPSYMFPIIDTNHSIGQYPTGAEYELELFDTIQKFIFQFDIARNYHIEWYYYVNDLANDFPRGESGLFITAGIDGYTFGTRSSSQTASMSRTASKSPTMSRSLSASQSSSSMATPSMTATFSSSETPSASPSASPSWGNFVLHGEARLGGVDVDDFGAPERSAFRNATAIVAGVRDVAVSIVSVVNAVTKSLLGIDIMYEVYVSQDGNKLVTPAIELLLEDSALLETALTDVFESRNLTYSFTSVEAINVSVGVQPSPSPSVTPSQQCFSNVCPVKSDRMEAEALLREELASRGIDRRGLPLPDAGGPVHVDMSLNIFSLRYIDFENGGLEMRVWNNLQWMDTRLAWNTTVHDIDKLQMDASLADLWTPDVTVMNQEKSFGQTLQQQRPVVSSDGTVTWSRPGLVASDCTWSVIDTYPWDYPECTFQLGTWQHTSDELSLQTIGPGWTFGGLEASDTVSHIDGETASNKQFKIYRIMATDGRIAAFGNNMQRSVVQFTVQFHRSLITPYITRTILPNIMFSLMSFSCFFLSPESGERIRIGLFAILAQLLAALLFAPATQFTGQWSAFNKINSALLYLSIVSFAETCVVCALYFRAQILGTQGKKSTLETEGGEKKRRQRGGSYHVFRNVLKEGKGFRKAIKKFLTHLMSPPITAQHKYNLLQIELTQGSRKRAKLLMDHAPEELIERNARERVNLRQRIKLAHLVADLDKEHLQHAELKYRLWARNIDVLASIAFPIIMMSVLFSMLSEIFTRLSQIDAANIYPETQLGYTGAASCPLSAATAVIVAVVAATTLNSC